MDKKQLGHSSKKNVSFELKSSVFGTNEKIITTFYFWGELCTLTIKCQAQSHRKKHSNSIDI